jgi:hypothetical protein
MRKAKSLLCEHHQLRRQCEICCLEDRIDEVREWADSAALTLEDWNNLDRLVDLQLRVWRPR